MAQVHLVDAEISDVFSHALGTTGLTATSFSYRLFRNNVLSSLKMTIAEVGEGYYSAVFTPDAIGIWSLDIWETSVSTTHYVSEYNVVAAETRHQIAEEVRRIDMTMQHVLKRMRR